MLFISKLLTQLIYPLNVCLLLVPLGLLLRRGRWRRLGRGLLVFGLGWVLLWSLPVASFWLRAGLERQYAQRAPADFPPVAAIVVLGGGVDGVRHGWRDDPNLLPAADRVWFAARLYHAGRAPLVILSGGLSEWSDSDQVEADAMAQFIGDLGVPAAQILLESRSRNTYENAIFTAELLQQHRLGPVLLVTSALHMPRAVALFEQQGIIVVPAPTDFEALPPRAPWLLRWMPDAAALEGSSRAFKEYLGLMAYRLFGLAAG